jgi:preprotein translocase subunit YajC
VTALFGHNLLLLAQNQPNTDATGGLLKLMLPLTAIMVLFYFMMIRPQKRKEEDFRQLVGNLKENDHVVTVGGIYGVVTNVQRDAERVTIRVDEGTGTKLRISTSAIARVVTGDEPSGDSAASGSSKK